jgi:hypothetical protein
MDALLTRPELRERLVAVAKRRAAPFNWNATARATLTSYDRALEDDE